MTDHTTLPRWDLSPFFPSIDSDEFRNAFDAIRRDISELEKSFDRLRIDKGNQAPGSLVGEVLDAINVVLERFEVIVTYVGCVVTTDTRDEKALAAESEMDVQASRLRKLSKRLTAWLGEVDAEEAASASMAVQAHRYTVERAKVAATHLMEPSMESLASDMELTGGVAWAKLYNQVSSQVVVTVENASGTETMPMSSARALASDASRDVRRAAYEAELKAWQTVEVPIAAAINCIKGETLLLSRRRRWSPLDAACHAAAIDRGTLDAMMTAAFESFPEFRRYFHAKARALGLERLAWFDLFAPLSSDAKPWDYATAETFVADQFGTFSPRMAEFAQRAFRERWIDAEPRQGKVDGAYCAPFRDDESRILLNYDATFSSVRTLAHELGHAYHSLCLNGRTPLQKETPMTLAETASIFCETIVKNGVLKHGTDAEKLVVLETSLVGASQVVVDITSRFLFESRLFDLREKRDASPRELCGLMLKAQEDTYGDGLDPNLRHGYMWAAKPHYYGSSFYNFPYMFGLLFGLGLFTIYRQEGKSFQARYDALLSSTGMADAATLADGFGINIRTPEFWRGSLDQVRQDVDLFETLV